MTTVYTGIGSRDTPLAIQERMSWLAADLASDGWTLRSGAATGADTAFALGAGATEIYVPWQTFGAGTPGDRILATELPTFGAAMEIAAEHHRAWNQLTNGAQLLMARNVFQVLGRDLHSPSAMVICWAPKPILDEDGDVCSVAGGTGQAVRIAYTYGIPVYHFDLHADAIERFGAEARAPNRGLLAAVGMR